MRPSPRLLPRGARRLRRRLRGRFLTSTSSPGPWRDARDALLPGLLFLGVVAVKLALARRVPGPWLFSDSTVHARIAAEILSSGWNALRGAAQDYTILYPVLIAPAFLFDGRAEAHQAALAINAVVSTSALFPLYWIARRILPAGIAFTLTAVIAFLPSVFVYSLALSSEDLFLPLFWWGTFLLLRLAQRDHARDGWAAGLVLGLLPAVKLTGFAILPAAAVLVVGMVVFHRIGTGRAAAFLAALLLPQALWVTLRALIASPERGLFGFGPGVGESLVLYLSRVDTATLGGFVRYFVAETTYVMAGAYVAWIAFSLYLVVQYRTWRARSVEGVLLLWTVLAAVSLAFVTVVFLFPIGQSLTDPEQRAREIYGRFVEVLFPGFFILGTRGMIDFAWQEREPRSRARVLLLLVVVLVLSGMSIYPLTAYAVASPFRSYGYEWLGARRMLGVALLVVVLALPAAGALIWLRGKSLTARHAGLALALLGVLGLHAIAFTVTIVGTVRGARFAFADLHRIGRWLETRAGPHVRVAYDRSLGVGDQYFAYRYWSDADWKLVDPDDLPRQGAVPRSEYVVTNRSLDLPVLVEEANGVRLYRLPS